jgi:nucleotide-binding universal stress UspA family protein
MSLEIKKILYATDLSKNSTYAFRYALDLAAKYGAKITILYVLEALSATGATILSAYLGPEHLLENVEERRGHIKERIGQRLQVYLDKVPLDWPRLDASKVDVVISEGYPAEQILEQADKLECDMIVMGTHGKGFLQQTFLGSVAKRVLRRAHKPITIVPLPSSASASNLDEI